VGTLFEQSENNSEKLGLRATWAGRPLASAPVDVVAGVDVLRDRTFQRLVQTDRNWVPETTFRNVAPFVQADVDVGPLLDLSAGLRWEVAELDVPDFTTIAGNRDDFEPLTVQGGAPAFDEPLLNVGAVLTPTPGLRLYGTFAQAYSMPDVGRVLRGVSQPGTAVETFLDLEPVKTDNVEAGAVHSTASTRFGVTWFQSESDFGTRLVPNADGIFEVFRQPTRTRGWEFTGRVDPTRALSLQAGWSILDGAFDADDDGEYDADLGAGDIGPDRLNMSAEWRASDALSARLQVQNFFDRTFEGADGAETARFDGYRTVDASIATRVRRSRVTLGIANLLDEQYITYFGQAATGRDDRFFAGRGRALTLRIDTTF
jgi:iron complex outermembrane receptor protein